MRLINRQAIFLGTVVAMGFFSFTAQAGSVPIFGSGGSFSVPIKNLKEVRFSNVIKQHYDYSCGSAALATLLTYHYEQTVSEQDVFRAMYERGDQVKIRKHGFSLLDMKTYLESRGYQADGFRISLKKLANLRVPAIALINTNGYLHFVVIKGVTKKKVLIGDSAVGIRALDRSEFESIWNGILFLVRNKVNVARNHFNKNKEWLVHAEFPYGEALSRASLASFTLSLPRRGEF